MMNSNGGRNLSPGEVVQEPEVADKPPVWQENLNIHLTCKECREFPPNLVEEFSSGDTVCGSCGLVLAGRIIDTRSEWRTFSNDDQGNDDPSRVGDAANPLLNGSQLQTTISFGNGNARTRELHRAQSKATNDKSTRVLLAAYKQIGALCDAWHLPHTATDTAKHLFKLTDDAKAFKGKSQDAIIAGCIFIACRQNNVPRTFREIHALTKVAKKDIGRTFKVLEKFFALQQKNQATVTSGGLVLSNDVYSPTTSTNASELCRRYCSRLGLSAKSSAMSSELAERMSSVGSLAGRSPLSAASACIYMISHLMGEPKSPKDIAAVAGVSDGTIRTSYKHLYQERDQLMPMDWVNFKGGDVNRLPVA